MPSHILQSDIHRILIRGLNWRLGDSLMTTPAIRAIKHTFPAAEIDVVIPPRVERVFAGNPDITNIIHFDTTAAHKGIGARLSFALALKKKRYDMAVLFQRAFEAALLTRLAGIPRRVGYASDKRGMLLTHPVPETEWSLRDGRVHQVEYYLEMLRAHLPIANEHYPISIQPLPEDRQSLLAKITEHRFDIERPYLFVAPGTSYGTAKRWETESWRNLFLRLKKKFPKTAIVLGGAPEDREYCESLSVNGIVNLAGVTSIGELIQLIDHARAAVTIDNGAMHLAAARNKPLLAIFGSTNPITTGPYGHADAVIRKEIYCSRCMERECPEGHHRCMKLITVDEVFERIAKLLS